MRVFEHCEACPAPCGGETVNRSMRRVANATLLRMAGSERTAACECSQSRLRRPLDVRGNNRKGMERENNTAWSLYLYASGGPMEKVGVVPWGWAHLRCGQKRCGRKRCTVHSKCKELMRHGLEVLTVHLKGYKKRRNHKGKALLYRILYTLTDTVYRTVSYTAHRTWCHVYIALHSRIIQCIYVLTVPDW